MHSSKRRHRLHKKPRGTLNFLSGEPRNSLNGDLFNHYIFYFFPAGTCLIQQQSQRLCGNIPPFSFLEALLSQILESSL